MIFFLISSHCFVKLSFEMSMVPNHPGHPPPTVLHHPRTHPPPTRLRFVVTETGKVTDLKVKFNKNVLLEKKGGGEEK